MTCNRGSDEDRVSHNPTQIDDGSRTQFPHSSTESLFWEDGPASRRSLDLGGLAN